MSLDQGRSAEARRPLAGRDKAVFTSMRRNQQRGPGRQEFFTDSTQTSYIPSPSPAKSSNYAAKPRQKIGSAKSLSESFRTSYNNKENEPLQSKTAQDQRSISRTSSPKRSSIHVSAQGSPRPSARPFSSLSRSATRTPSPRRDTEDFPLVSPASFVSESSVPPQALPEIYQRIEDEEFLAGLEGAEDDLLATGRESPEQQILKRFSASPARHTSTSARQASPQSRLSDLVGKEAQAEPTPQLPSSRGSSPFEDLLEANPEMLARDEYRVREAINSDTRAFTKARRGKASLTLENLRRQEAGSNSSKESAPSRSLSSGRGSEPSLNVPAGWGRKARNGRRWMNGITEDKETVKAGTEMAGVDEAPVSQEGVLSTKSVRNWLKAAVATPLPSSEDSLTAEKDLPERNGNARTQSESRLREQPFAEKATKWNDQGGAQLEPTKSSNSAFTAPRERSIERLEKSAVTTNRLGALGDKRSLEKLARKYRESADPKISDAQLNSNVETRGDSDDLNQDHSLSEIAQVQSIQNGYQELHHDVSSNLADDNITKVAQTDDASAQQDLRTADSIADPEIAGQAPKTNQESQLPKLDFAVKASMPGTADSRDLLRRFARASSSSPAPTRSTRPTSTSSDRIDTRQPSPLSVGSEDRRLVKDGRGTGPDREVVKSEPQDGGEPSRQTLATDTDATGTGQAPSAHINGTETPMTPKSKAYLKTPKVTGAWIDTPIVTTKKLGIVVKDTSNSVEEEEDQGRDSEGETTSDGITKAAKQDDFGARSERDVAAIAMTAPKLPRSALAAIVEHAKRKNRGQEGPEGDGTLQLDDSTIRSLEELLVKDESPTETATAQDILSEPDALITGLSKVASTLSSTRQSLGSINKALKQPPSPAKVSDTSPQLMPNQAHTSKLASGSAACNKPSLNIITKTDPAAPSKKPKASVVVLAPDEACDEAGEFHDFIWPCEACRRRARASATAEDDSIGVVQWQTIQIPRLWHWNNTTGSTQWVPRLTKLGWFLLVTGSYMLAEWYVSALYTPPFFAETMVGFGVDYDAPRPPFVIPKLLWKGPVGELGRAIWLAVCVVARAVTGVLGIDAGIFGHAPVPAQGPRPGTRWVFREAFEPAINIWGREGGVDVGIGADEVLI